VRYTLRSILRSELSLNKSFTSPLAVMLVTRIINGRSNCLSSTDVVAPAVVGAGATSSIFSNPANPKELQES
jgi:hypothetical protein